jgi:hypothetical protein
VIFSSITGRSSSSSLLGSNVFPRCFPSLPPLTRVLAGQTEFDAMGTRMFTITFGAQLITLIASSTDSTSHRLFGSFRIILPIFPTGITVAETETMFQ